MKTMYGRKSPKYLLSALNCAIRCSEINSSTEDSSFLSPSIIQGVWGKFLEYLLYLPVKDNHGISNHSAATSESCSLAQHTELPWELCENKLTGLSLFHGRSVTHVAASRRVAVARVATWAGPGKPVATVLPPGITPLYEIIQVPSQFCYCLKAWEKKPKLKCFGSLQGAPHKG